VTKRAKWSVVILAVVVLIVSYLALQFGAVYVQQPLSVFADRAADPLAYSILTEIRLPRVLIAILAGFAIGAAGLLAQSAFTNPIAEPSIIGASGGAALGSALALSVGVSTPWLIALVAVAVAGVFVASTYLLAVRKGQLSGYRFIVVGIAVSAIAVALTGFLAAIDTGSGRSILFWTLGSLSLARPDQIPALAVLVLVAIALSWRIMNRLDLLNFGDEYARINGISVRSLRAQAVLLIAILIGVSVSVVGIVAFLGLAAPHIARSFLGFRNQNLLLPTGLIAALLLLLGDTLARNLLAPTELPLTIFVAIIAAPILVLAARRTVIDERR